MNCQYTRYRDSARMTVMSERAEYLNGYDCTPFSYIIILIEFLTGTQGVPETIAPVERVWLHQWRGISAGVCDVPLAHYYLKHELRSGDRWSLIHVESGIQDSPDYGSYMSDAAIGYCHNENNDLDANLLELLDATLLPNYPNMMDELIIPVVVDMHWDGVKLTCNSGVSGECCESTDPPPLPPLPPNGSTTGSGYGASFKWSSPPDDPRDGVDIGGAWFIPPHQPDYPPCSAVQNCQWYSWIEHRQGPITPANPTGWAPPANYWHCRSYTTNGGETRYKLTADLGAAKLYDVQVSKDTCNTKGYLSSRTWVTIGSTCLLNGTTPTIISSGDKPGHASCNGWDPCKCTRWRIRYYYVVKFAFLQGFRTMAEVYVDGCPSGARPTISPEGVIMCDGAAIGQVGFALSTFLFYRVEVLNVQCISGV